MRCLDPTPELIASEDGGAVRRPGVFVAQLESIQQSQDGLSERLRDLAELVEANAPG